jgi:diguanylate cyclase
MPLKFISYNRGLINFPVLIQLKTLNIKGIVLNIYLYKHGFPRTDTEEPKLSTTDSNKSDYFDFARLEQLIKEGKCDCNSLLPVIKRFSEDYAALEQQVARLLRDNKELTVQMVEISRSLDLASRIDPMTGLANRRDIMEKITREYSRATRHKSTFSIILADVDNFKQINEVYGYNAGDDVLVEISRVLMSCLRSEDICARWKGEAFLVLLPETAEKGAATVASKIHESIDMTEFKAQKPGIRTTISLGICEYNSDQTLFDCIIRAEQALHKAKADGKNQLCIA